jgi:hypothetical protein
MRKIELKKSPKEGYETFTAQCYQNFYRVSILTEILDKSMTGKYNRSNLGFLKMLRFFPQAIKLLSNNYLAQLSGFYLK